MSAAPGGAADMYMVRNGTAGLHHQIHDDARADARRHQVLLSPEHLAVRRKS